MQIHNAYRSAHNHIDMKNIKLFPLHFELWPFFLQSREKMKKWKYMREIASWGKVDVTDGHTEYKFTNRSGN